MKVKYLLAVSLLAGLAFTLSAQQSVVRQSTPIAPANAEVLKLLKAGMPESVVLSKIHAITEKFDTSADALVTLKQAGASEAELTAILTPQGTAPGEPKAASAHTSSVPTDSGPTLAETMKFIQDKLNGLGKVSFVVSANVTDSGDTATATFTDEYSNVVADPDQCRISYHQISKPSSDGNKSKGNTGFDNTLSLRKAENIIVSPYVQSENAWRAKHGDTNFVITSTTPSITELSVRRVDGEDYRFSFTDNDLALRVAKAFARAVTLCGGGNKDPF
jgi:hypothetical protein